MDEIRTRAIQLVQAGESPERVIKTLGFSRACIYNWLAKCRAGGWDALRTGHRPGRPKKLDASQIIWVEYDGSDKPKRRNGFHDDSRHCKIRPNL
ncbi:helix-turn-helix domain-containing protein [Desulfocicer niacini]